MYYLINKITGEVIAENEKKSRLRKKQKTLTDKDNFKVSKFKTNEPKNPEENKNGKSTKSKPEVEEVWEELHGIEMRKRLSDYKDHTEVMSRAQIEKHMKQLKVESYLIQQHASGQYYAFYN